MADLTLRTVKGSELTFQEIDDNFSNLDSDAQSLQTQIADLLARVEALENP